MIPPLFLNLALDSRVMGRPDMEVGHLMCMMASREAERYFKKNMMKDTNHLPECRNASSLGFYMIDSVFSWYSPQQDTVGVNLNDLPTDYFQLAKVLQTFFSTKLCNKFEKRCLHFDVLVEREHASPVCMFNRSRADRLAIASAMLSEHTVEYWIRLLCKSVAAHCFRVAAAKFGNLIDPRTMQTRDAKAVLRGLVNKYDERCSKKGCPFTQLALQGPDLVTAWKRSCVTGWLEAMAPRQDMGPSESRNVPVYHGTAAHLNEFEDDYMELVSLPIRGLSGRDNVYGIIPSHAHINVTHTTFSPFRSFLSTVFRAEVIDKLLSRKRDHVWKSGDEDYEGVMLFQFDPQERAPASTGYSSYIIPAEQRAAWRERTGRRVCLQMPPPHCWDRFADIHGQPRGTDWPFIIHEREAAERRGALQPLTGASLWHSVWCGEGVFELSNSHKKSFAIKYDIKPGEGEQGGKGGNVKSMLKKLLKRG